MNVIRHSHPIVLIDTTFLHICINTNFTNANLLWFIRCPVKDGVRNRDSILPSDLITLDDALRNADSQNELRLRIKLEGKAAKGRNILDEAGGLALEDSDEESGMLR